MSSEEDTTGTASSKELLYSEYMNSTAAEHVVLSIQKKALDKPVMQFKRSSVLERVKKFLPLLEQSQKDLSDRNPKEYNIEDLQGNDSFVEMDVAVVEGSDENCDGDSFHFEFGNTENRKSKNSNSLYDELSNSSCLNTENEDSNESSDLKNSTLNLLESDDTNDSLGEPIHKIILKENILTNSTCLKDGNSKNNFEDERPLKKLRT